MLEDEEGYEEEFETEYEDEKFEQVNIEAARREQGKKQTEESIDFDELQTLSRKFSDQALTDAISRVLWRQERGRGRHFQRRRQHAFEGPQSRRYSKLACRKVRPSRARSNLPAQEVGALIIYKY